MGEGKLSIVTASGAAALYLSTLSRWYSADSLWFALALESPDRRARIDPYHLLLHPLSWLWVEIWRAFGWTGLSIHALQVLNALAGAVSVALIASIAARVSGSRAAAALVAAGCAVSGGLWILSTEAEDVTLGLAAQLAVVRWLLAVPAGGYASMRWSWLLGGAIGAATLVYASNALLLGVAALAHWQGRTRWPFWRRSLAWACAGFVCLAAPLVPVTVDLGAPFAEQAHMLSRFFGGTEYGRLTVTTLPRGIYAFLRMVMLFPGLGINDRTTHFLATAGTIELVAFFSIYVITAIVVAAPLLFLWRYRVVPHTLQRLLLWGALFAAFAFWWVPSDLEFWIPVAAAWWIAFALVIAQRPRQRYSVVVLIVTLLLANGFGLILPHRDATRNAPLQTALRLAHELKDGDRVIAVGTVHVFMRYFTGRDSIRFDTRTQLEAAVSAARARPAPHYGRLIIAGTTLDDSQRTRWRAAPLSDESDTVWLLP